ncbi:hypothetical protein [Aeromonas veronii]|uniref:Uncharacterized protein n=1 Tax=Aeromonas veronii TaxID=654 RepID=A0A2T4MWF8_AERVE|nr:hypothetical protein [Aeromonas veronii]PTH78931.1 hypothetical protein DAA48_21050 [Aeromonas veronii]
MFFMSLFLGMAVIISQKRMNLLKSMMISSAIFFVLSSSVIYFVTMKSDFFFGRELSGMDTVRAALVEMVLYPILVAAVVRAKGFRPPHLMMLVWMGIPSSAFIAISWMEMGADASVQMARFVMAVSKELGGSLSESIKLPMKEYFTLSSQQTRLVFFILPVVYVLYFMHGLSYMAASVNMPKKITEAEK